jgi:putative intracellular protease/amidase
MDPIKVLFVTTSHDELGDTGRMTGVWLEELATPYYVFKGMGAEIILASPNGGLAPLDPKSQSIIVATPSTKRFLKDEEALIFLSHSIPLEKAKASAFDMVFLPGGHGPMWDLAGNNILKKLLEDFNNANKPIGSVSHGVVGLLSLQDNKGGRLMKDKELTCFSDSEEESAGLNKTVPFLLESAFRLMGASYSKGPDYVSHVVADGNIITGQNAASSGEVAKKMIALVQQNKQQPVIVG